MGLPFHASVSPFASHSNAFSLYPHPRNLKDDQIRALIQSRGFIGINFNPPFLSEQPRCSLSTIVSHILHILDLGGEDILGFGSDFEGVSSLPAGMFGAQSYPALLSALQTAGVDQPLLDKLAHQNLVRYLSLFY
ncbi:MAG: dipeptidase [Christensenellales bacterium]